VLEVATICVFIGVRIIKEMPGSVASGTHGIYNKAVFFLISNFRHVLNVVCFLLGNSPASEFYMPAFRNTLSHLHRWVGMKNDRLRI
jgi:hypothetical protein